MSLAPTIYSSEDSGAPVLTGQIGSLVALLDAILVNGYGSGQSAKASLGWTIEFTGTNKRAYRGSMSSGSGHYLRVNDAWATVCSFRGYIAMSDVDTGTDVFPTIAERANGMLVVKSSAASSATRSWWAIGNERCFYLYLNHANLTVGAEFPYFFGDVIPWVDSDDWYFAIPMTTVTGTSATTSQGTWLGHRSGVSDVSTAGVGMVFSRNAAGSSVATNGHVGSLGNPRGGATNQGLTYQTGFDYPEPVTGGFYYGLGVAVSSSALRGRMPGLYVPFHNTSPGGNLATLTDVEGLPEGTVLLVKGSVSLGFSTANANNLLFDISHAWDA